jgi:hypothetical protein
MVMQIVITVPRVIVISSFLSWFGECPSLDYIYIIPQTFQKVNTFFKSFLLVFRRTTSKLLGLRYRKTLPSVTHNARVFLFGVLQELPRSPQPLVLRMPAATPHLPSLSAVARPCKYRMGVISRAAVGIAIVGRSVASLPSSLHTYYTTQSRKSQPPF